MNNPISKTLSKTELEIMQYLWHIDREVTAREIRNNFSYKNWSKQTISTYLKRLVDVGLINIRKVSVTKYFYSVAITEEQYNFLPVNSIVNSKYRGSLSKFFCALIKPNNISINELDELEKYLKKMRKEKDI